MAQTTVTKRRIQPAPIEQILLPFQEFARLESSGGILLIASIVVAMVWANSALGDLYNSIWQTKLTFGLGNFQLSKPLLLWINDGLMAIFFFVIGLEIKREVIVGELSSLRKAALPIAAAIGGMLLPAAIFTAFNFHGAGERGWGIPMATDIAFALGILSLLGKRVPMSLKVFLTAVAIVDDIGAVLVIAIFYTAKISASNLLVAALFLLGLLLINRLGVRRPLPYVVLGIGLWGATLLSGVHATVAGVLLAMTIPVRTRIDAEEFLRRGRGYMNEFEDAGDCTSNVLPCAEQRAALQAMETIIQQAESPLQRLEHTLHPWVIYAIMPIFALTNAGIVLRGDLSSALLNPVTLGVVFGLVLGKQLGVTLAAWLITRSGFAALPSGVTWRHIYGAAWLAGVGFTMSLFVSGLAFGEGPLLNAAKVGILAASLLAALSGWWILRGAAAPSQTSTQPG